MALYNNGFPVNYQQVQQPVYQQPVYQMQPQMQGQQYQQQAQQQPLQQPVQQNSSIIWVQGEAGAKSYLVAPNNTVQLWDSERHTIYLKSADASGMPSMKTLDYTIREPVQAMAPVPVAPTNLPKYALKDDVDALYGQISALRAELDTLNKKPAPKPKKEVAENE